jgi:hypothetical protein
VQKLAIDASTAAKWQLAEEPEAERARHMLRDYAAEKVAFVTPTIWHYEVAVVCDFTMESSFRHPPHEQFLKGQTVIGETLKHRR